MEVNGHARGTRCEGGEEWSGCVCLALVPIVNKAAEVMTTFILTYFILV